MRNLIKYIVLFFLCFKISLVSSAEIDTSSLSDEIPVPDTSFKAVLNLPKPAEMSQLIRDSETLLDQMLLIGAYFNLRYPGSTLNTDLTQDINEMFPDLTEKESKERAEWVQKAITLYRWGVNKYEKIKEEMLVPPEPPLILSDDQYGFSDNEPYLPTDENQFAIKYDFKKIIPYSTNPKDMASTRARSQKTAEEKKHKTNFEKFKSMVDKLELSKLPRYGIDLPNPLIGDAGTTPWITKDFYKTRLLAELAVYEGEPQFLAGVHVVVPAHRIMLGTSLGRLLQKPQIDLISSQNIADFEVFYPVPFSMISDRMIGGYAGDFLFPIRITPQAPDKPVEMKVRIAFQDCDVRLECKPLEFEHDLLIETSEEDALSSFRNFVQQSFNNLPQPPKPEFSAETFEAQVQKETQNVDEIRLVMKAPSNINNIALFLEDKEGTTFKRPKISVHSGKIYAVFPLTEPVSNLIGRKFQLTAQLNQFEKITQTLTLTEATLHTTQNKASTLSLDLLLAGLLFVFTPIGFCLFLWLYTSSRRTDFENISLQTLLTLVCAVSLSGFALYRLKTAGTFLYWGMQYQNVFAMSTVIVLMFVFFLTACNAAVWRTVLAPLKPLIVGTLIVLLAPFSFVPYLKKGLFDLWMTQADLNGFVTQSLSFALGAGIPYFLASFNVKQLPFFKILKIRTLAKRLIQIQIAALWLILAIQNPLITMLKITLVLAAVYLFLLFIFYVADTMRQTQLQGISHRQFSLTLLLIAVGIVYFLLRLVPEVPHSAEVSQTPDQEQIQADIATGQTVMIRWTADWCFTCHFTKWTAFNLLDENLFKSGSRFRLITVYADRPDEKTLEYYRLFDRASPPLTVIYNYQVKDGLALPDLLSSRDVHRILNDFSI